MKTEKFDEHIKNKLEQVHHPVAASELDRIHQHVLKHQKGIPLIKKWGSYFVVAAAASLSTLLIYQYFIPESQSPVQNIQLTSTPINPQASELNPIQKQESIESSQLNHTQKNTNTITFPSKNNSSQSPYKIHSNNQITIEKEQIQINDNENESLQNHYIQSYELNFLSNIQLQTLNLPENGNPEWLSYNQYVLPRIYKKTNPSNQQYKIGLGTDYHQYATSYGLYFDWNFKNNLVISSGLQASIYHRTELYRDELEFNSITKQNFRNQYDIDLPHNTKIMKIMINKTRVQLPVNIGYNFVLKHGFSLKPSIGINLNLLTNSQVVYDIKQQGPFMLRTENTKKNIMEPRLENGLLYIGLEKRWNRFSIQAGPIYTALLHKQRVGQSIRNTDGIGVRARMYYSL